MRTRVRVLITNVIFMETNSCFLVDPLNWFQVCPLLICLVAGVVAGNFDNICPRYLNCQTFSIGSLSGLTMDVLDMVSSGALKIIVLVLSVAIVKPKRLKVLL